MMPLWWRWRVAAAIQWWADIRGKEYPTSGTNQTLVRCSTTETGHRFSCEFCGGSYGDVVTFFQMSNHIIREHPEQATQVDWVGRRSL